jgi:hypothetical protein
MPSTFPSEAHRSPILFNPITPESNHSESPILESPQSPHKRYETSDDQHDDDELEPPKKKSKAGRKPLYKTVQERRDRNRRAQLAFRARRSDYLARLEETCRSLEGIVTELQESNRQANDSLARERSRVRYLEKLLQTCFSHFPSQQQSVPTLYPTPGASISIPADDGGVMPSPVDQRGVSVSPLQQDLSLIALEQQFSSVCNMPNDIYNTNMMYPTQPLGMLPLPLFNFVS